VRRQKEVNHFVRSAGATFTEYLRVDEQTVNLVILALKKTPDESFWG
jgi:hypothetical protein